MAVAPTYPPQGPAPLERRLTGPVTRSPADGPGWSIEFTAEFVDVWLDDYCIRAQVEPGLRAQMDEHARACFGCEDAGEFTRLLVADLEVVEDLLHGPECA